MSFEPVFYDEPEPEEPCRGGRVLRGDTVIMEGRGLHRFLYEQGLQQRERDAKTSQKPGGKKRRRKR